MIKLQRDAQLANIFYEWAADYKEMGYLEQAGFWSSIAMAFRCGCGINADAIEAVKHAAIENVSSPHPDIAMEAELVLNRLNETGIPGGMP